VDSQTGEVVSREDIARGYEVGKGQYLVFEDEEFEAIQIESTRTIDIDQFVQGVRSTSAISIRRTTSCAIQVGEDAFAVIEAFEVVRQHGGMPSQTVTKRTKLLTLIGARPFTETDERLREPSQQGSA
jgi:DNA end-binding protein Ku